MPIPRRSLNRNSTLPSNFVGASSYSLFRDSEIATVNATSGPNMDGLLVGDYGLYPAWLAMYFLPIVNDPNVVMKLFISAVAAAGNLSALQIKAENLEVLTGIEEAFRKYVNYLVQDEKELDDTSLAHIKFPVPSWIDQELDAAQFEGIIHIDEAEASAYVGALCLAVAEQPTAKHIERFRKRCAELATSGLMSAEPKILTTNSNILSLDVLKKINRVASYRIVPREITMRSVATNIGSMTTGNAYVFACCFALAEDSGMGGLIIMRKVLSKYPTLEQIFPQYIVEFRACRNGVAAVMNLPPAERCFCKTIYGSKFVPVKRSDINHLLGIYVYIGTKSEPGLIDFVGGILLPSERLLIDKVLGFSDKGEEK